MNRLWNELPASPGNGSLTCENLADDQQQHDVAVEEEKHDIAVVEKLEQRRIALPSICAHAAL